MKKSVKIVSIALVIMMALLSVSNVVLASGIPGKIDQIAAGSTDVEDDKIIELGAKIVTIMQTVGIVVAVVILLILGIKYIMGSAEVKAEYKKTMVPYVVGAILIFASTTIVNIVYQLANGLN